MKNSNIIISVIIVLCIAGGVTAYTMTNPEGNIFSLPGYTPSDDVSTSGDDGAGNISANNESGSSDSSSGGSSSGNSGSSSGSTVSTAKNSNSGNSGGSGNSGSSGSTGISASKAKSIASGYIEEGTAGTPSKSGNQWIVPVFLNGSQVGAIYINAQTGANEGGEGGAP